MFSLISLILMLFNILAAILILVMAGIAIALLLALFLIVAIVVGLKEKSLFKGLKVFVVASAILTIVPAIEYLFIYKFDNFFSLSHNQLLIVGGIVGLILSIIFGILSFHLFEKIAKYIYKSISERKLNR